MTTERVLPAIALPQPARPAPRAVRPRPAASTATTRRGEALLTTPARAAMLVGASAAVYAVSLAGVSGLQSSSDAALIARTQPWLDQVAEARAANDELEAALIRASTEAQALGAAYEAAGDELVAYEARLDSLAALVAEVKGTAAALPSRIGLPKVTVRGAARTTRPATKATSGASGG
ncbi:MAG: hypothetical protein AB1627_04230 [Chloroflexota bacterium]